MLRAPKTAGEYYHVYNRGNNKQDVFLDEFDSSRFLLSLLLMQSEDTVQKSSRLVSRFLTRGVLPLSEAEVAERTRQPQVHVCAFALMPNHFHLLLCERVDEGISKYMQRLLGSYTKYSNTKRERVGHVFQGPYQFVHVEDDDQLVYLSAYIHRNPRDLPRWRGKEHLYPWSSYQDYVSGNRWGELLQPQIVMGQFSRNGARYKRYVEQSGAKNRVTDPVLLIDRDEALARVAT